MAAIDKLYVKDYYEFSDLVEWAIIYYPILLRRFYNWKMTYEEYNKGKKNWVKTTRKHIITSYKKLGKFKNKYEAVSNLIEYYKVSANYNCPLSQAESEVDIYITNYRKSNSELEDEYSFPACNFSLKDDLYLKWHCPLSFVRDYLHNQCGVNPKLEWLYKLFWKGKNEFCI